MAQVQEISFEPVDRDVFWEASSGRPDDTRLCDEYALSIAYNGLNHSVMMVSPTHLEDLVLGFTCTQGWIASAQEIYAIEIESCGESLRAEVELSSRAFWQLKQARRALAGQSGCGVCGVEALEQAVPALQPLSRAPLPSTAALQGLRERLAVHQVEAQRSGAVHAAAYVDSSGQVRVCREDIGRHNALDKLGGVLLKTPKADWQDGFAVVTSRCSLELIVKAVRLGVTTLASLSAPSRLGVRYARKWNLNLIHIPHQSAPRIFSPAPDAEESP